MKKELFSLFLPPVWVESPPNRDLSVVEVWEYITGRKVLEIDRLSTTGGLTHLGTLQTVTGRVRSLPPEVYSDKLKGKVTYLPLCTFGGVFSQRDGVSLQETSGLINLDIDHISQLGGVSLEDLKERISQDREIGLRLLFTSPSGDGLKIVCKTSGEITDRESYRREFETLNYFVSQKYSIPIGSIGLDKGISNINRGCLLCYDPGAILRDWEDIFNPALHPIPREEGKKPRRDSRRDSVSVWDWDSYLEERLIPSLFERIDSVFPEMSFRYSGKSWESPYKLDGTDSKKPRRDKTVITSRCPGVVLEQGGEAIPVVEYYRQKHRLQYGDSLRELSRLCGLEEEYKDLSRRYAKMKEQETQVRENSPRTGEETPSVQAVRTTPSQTSPKETPEDKIERYKRDYLTIQDLKTIASTKREGIKTEYVFKDSQGRAENLILTSGCSILGGQSSHGKSRLLQNISLQIATEEYNKGGEGVVLYFAFEETLLEVITRYANIQVNIPHLSGYQTKNSEVLLDYFQTGKLNKSPQNIRTEALPRLSSFVNNLYNSGRLRIYYTPDLYSGDLCSLLRYLSSQMKIKAVFLDYIQAIYKEGYKKDRREELREISKELNSLAKKELDCPIVASAQLNRETPSPTDMSGSNTAESQDIPRYADTLLLMWDSVRDRDLKDREKYLNSKDYSRLQTLGFNFGIPGKLYTILEKNRGSTPYLESILEYVPETGKISSNEDLPPGDSSSFSGNLVNLEL